MIKNNRDPRSFLILHNVFPYKLKKKTEACRQMTIEPLFIVRASR